MIGTLHQSEPAITVRDLSKQYGVGAPLVLQDVTFTVAPGVMVGLIGPNGAGKSTLMKILTGALPATSGNVFIHGQNIVKHPIAAKREIRLVQQSLAFDMFLDGAAALRIAAKFFGAEDPMKNPRILDLLERFNLTDVMHRPTFTLSGGQLRKLQITRALIRPSSVLILDEPTVGLDLASKMQLTSVLNQIVQEHGTSILLSSHVLSEIETLCDEVLLLQDGRIVTHDRTRSLVQSHGARSMALTLATPENTETAITSLKRIGIATITIDSNRIQFWVGQDINPVDVLSQLSADGLSMSDVIVLPSNLEQAYAAITTKARPS